MDEEKMLVSASTILNSHRIFCIGMESRISVVNILDGKLKNFGMWSKYNEASPFRDLSEIASEKDCIIVVSLIGVEQ